MSATQVVQPTASVEILYLGFDLGGQSWSVANTSGLGQHPRVRQILAGDFEGLIKEIGHTKKMLRRNKRAHKNAVAITAGFRALEVSGSSYQGFGEQA